MYLVFYGHILISLIMKPLTHGKRLAQKKVYQARQRSWSFPAWIELRRIRLMEDKKRVKLTATVTGSG